MINKRHLLAAGSAVFAFAAAPVFAVEMDRSKKNSIVNVPITFDGEGSPVVDVMISGSGPYRFMIDTGSSSALVRNDLAMTLKLSENGFVNTTSLAGSARRANVYLAHNILLGGIFSLSQMDMIGLDRLARPGFDGVLPGSILTALPTELDFEKAQIRYYLQGEPINLFDFNKISAQFQADYDGAAEKIYAHVKLDGHDLLCLVDTGAAGGLLLSATYVKSHNLWQKNADAGESSMAGANGEAVKTRLAKIANFGLGTVKFDDIWVRLIDPNGRDNMPSQGIDGIIGVQILRQFTLAFSEHRELFIRPNDRFSVSAGARPIVDHEFNAEQPVLPFLYRDDRRILLAATVNGKPSGGGCLINSAAIKSGIAPAAAENLGLLQVDDGFDGSVLAIDAVWHPPHLVLTSRSALAGRPYPIDLGLDFLTAQHSRLDFDVNELTLFLKSVPDVIGYYHFAQRTTGVDSHFYVASTLDGMKTLCAIDTFSTQTITLLPHAVRAHNLWDAFPDSISHKDSKGQETRLVKMAGFDAGGMHLATPTVLLMDPSSAEPSNLSNDAMLGMGFIHRCNWIFMADGNLYAKPNSFWTLG